MRKYAIIDFSSSSLSLLITRIDGLKMEAELHTRIPLSFGTTLYEGRVLTKIEKLEVLESAEYMLKLASENNVDLVFAIASSTLSKINEIEITLKEVEDKTGLIIQNLSQNEEADARLIANERYNILNKMVLIDFGSLNLKMYSFSSFFSHLPLGPISLYKKNVSQVVPSLKEALDIKTEIRAELDKAQVPREGHFENAVLAGIYSWGIWQLYSKYYDLEHEHGEKIIQYKKLKKLCKHLVKSNDRSMLILEYAPELMKQIVPATILAKEIVKRLKVNNIVISDLGVKEGILKEIVSGKRELKGISL